MTPPSTILRDISARSATSGRVSRALAASAWAEAAFDFWRWISGFRLARRCACSPSCEVANDMARSNSARLTPSGGAPT